jgi:hypothetical protein
VERRRGYLGVATVSDEVRDDFRHPYATASTTKARAIKSVLGEIDIRLTYREEAKIRTVLACGSPRRLSVEVKLLDVIN